MALFRRNDPEPTEPPARASVASEAQAVQLRGRARRRLVGAIALVLAAVIVLPMALDSEPIPVASDIPIVIPDRAGTYQPQFADDEDDAAQSAPQTTPQATQSPAQEQPESSAANSTPPNTTPPNTTSPNTAASTSAATGTTTTPASSTAKPASAPPQRPVTAASATNATPSTTATTSSRTDDGSRALALLEGRASEAAANTANAYVLQIAAYSNQNDAQTRRDQLIRAGVANAFVEVATVNGKPQYRLRVGPFASRAAAQAAQPRLRTLGYDNGFIAAQ